MSKIKIYIAGPFSSAVDRAALKRMIKIVKQIHQYTDLDLYIPMEYKVEGDYKKEDGTWNLPNYVWSKQVYKNDIKNLCEAEEVFVLYTGRKGTTGTAWEIGFAHGMNKKITLYIPNYAKDRPMSLMVLNSADYYIDFINGYPIKRSIDKNFLEKFNQK